MALFIVACLLLLLLPSCSPRIIEKVSTVTQVETVVEYRDSVAYRDSIIYVQLPSESHSEVVGIRDTSSLETSLAESRAWVDSVGLHHELRNKDRKWGVQLKYPERFVVSKAMTSSREQISVNRTQVKPLTLWQRIKIGTFWWLVAALVVAVGYIFRDQLLIVLKKIIPLLLKFIV